MAALINIAGVAIVIGLLIGAISYVRSMAAEGEASENSSRRPQSLEASSSNSSSASQGSPTSSLNDDAAFSANFISRYVPGPDDYFQNFASLSLVITKPYADTTDIAPRPSEDGTLLNNYEQEKVVSLDERRKSYGR